MRDDAAGVVLGEYGEAGAVQVAADLEVNIDRLLRLRDRIGPARAAADDDEAPSRPPRSQHDLLHSGARGRVDVLEALAPSRVSETGPKPARERNRAGRAVARPGTGDLNGGAEDARIVRQGRRNRRIAGRPKHPRRFAVGPGSISRRRSPSRGWSTAEAGIAVLNSARATTAISTTCFMPVTSPELSYPGAARNQLEFLASSDGRGRAGYWCLAMRRTLG